MSRRDKRRRSESPIERPRRSKYARESDDWMPRKYEPFPPFPLFPGFAPPRPLPPRDRDRDRNRDSSRRDRPLPPRRSGGGGGRREGSPVAGDSILRVANNSFPQTVAGAIAKRMRRGQSSVVDAAGPQAVHQAAKALAIARTYLDEDDLDICAVAELTDADEPARNGSPQEGAVMRFRVLPHKLSPYRITSTQPMKVAVTTEPKHTAGAIARYVRERVTCSVSALGADSVHQCCRALALGREFVRGDGLSYTFQPFFVDPNSNVIEFAIEAESRRRR